MKVHPRIKKHFDQIKTQGFITLNDWMDGEQILDEIKDDLPYEMIPGGIPDSFKHTQYGIENLL